MERVSTREAYGKSLIELGNLNNDVVVLEADTSKSTFTNLFAKVFPDRFFNIGIAEQNEVLIAAGMASCGKIPFVSGFAIFNSLKVCEQIRTFICYPKLNVKIVGSHCGLTACYDGVTHQSTEDMGVLRTIPGLTIIMPSDDIITRKTVLEAYKYKGPVYIRLTRNPVPRIYNNKTNFVLGKAIKIKDGKDITIISMGDMMENTIKVSEILEENNIFPTVLDMHTLKPIDSEMIIKSARKTGAVITIEDHNIINGLGSAVSEVLSENYPVILKRMGIPDIFCESGSYKDLISKYKLDINSIIKNINKLIVKK